MNTPEAIRQDITDRIVAALKAGKIPWRRPWSSVADPVSLPTNFESKRSYTGINISLLWMAQQEKGYPISYWATFDQWKRAGASVRRGEKSTKLIFFKPVSKSVRDDDGRHRLETFPLLKTWSVFNIAQVVGGVAEQYTAKPDDDDALLGYLFEDVDRTEFDRLVAATGADIRFGFDKAAYARPPQDSIMMPNEPRFSLFGDFASTLLHELAHWTEHRLGWVGDYASGELRAEMTASFVTSALGLPGASDLSNHTAYVQSWLQALENDPRHIFRASAAAGKAADYLLGFVRSQEERSEDETASVI
jgi:antirestriction protein ArdC